MFTKDRIRVVEKAGDWQEAIALAAEPLVADRSIEERYIQAMIDSVKELGFYIVLDEGLAMPHARPEAGVRRTGVAFLKLKEPCDFGGRPVELIFVLAAEDSDSHIGTISALAELFQDEDKMQRLKACNDPEELLAILA